MEFILVAEGLAVLNEWSQMAGEIDSPLDIDDFAAALTAIGIRVQVRESSHYQSGQYIRVCEGSPEFILEHVPGKYLAQANAATVEQMREIASRVSAALAVLDIHHAFELYDKSSVMVDYFHHRWPA